MSQSSHRSDAALGRRKVRKGTHSCWECRRRKIRCQYGPGESNVCIPCQERGSMCRSQEFADESVRTQRQHDRGLAQRLGRLEQLMVRLVDSVMPDARKGLSPSSDASSPLPHGGGASDMLTARPMVHNLEDGLLRPDESTSVGLLGIRNLDENRPQPPPEMLTPESDRTSQSLNRGIQAWMGPPAHERVCRSLYALFPSPHDVAVIAQETTTPYYLTALFHTHREMSEGKGDTPHTVSVIPPVESHPSVLARRLLQLSICMQHLSTEFDVGKLDTRYDIPQLMSTIIATVTNLVTSNDELVGTAEGLQSLVLQGYWHANAGNLRKAWLCYRRAISLGQLMGIDRPPGSSPPRALKFADDASDPDTRARPDVLWYCINSFDRSMSLLLNLPAGTTDVSFATPDAMKHDTDLERLQKLQTAITTRIIDRNAQIHSPQAYAMTQSIDYELETAARTMPSEWWADWAAPDMAHLAQSEPCRVFDTIMLQIRHYDLLILLHLPYMLRNPVESRYDYSKTTCVRSSRNVLQRFIEFRKRYSWAFSCRHIDYSALVAAMTLLVSYLRQHQNACQPEPSLEQRTADAQLLETARQCMQNVAQQSNDKLAQESAEMVEQLRPIMDSINATLGAGVTPCNASVFKCLHLNIPYLGSVNIHPSVSGLSSSSVTGTGFSADEDATPQASIAEASVPGMPQSVPSQHMQPGPSMTTTNGGVVPPDSSHLGVQSPPMQAVAPQDLTLNGMFMEFDPQMENDALELPLMAEAEDWVFQGVDTTYWSLLNANVMDPGV
ncbi:hypothetical protein VTK73DRAFT_5864 [Phialemonium thermophilum]|uniref:Zn(2)-C6 fungal-type domain-containing protein n=1 Tax=Phialemonium thermophilum TaxID=223376 RepID=A0ABR3WLP2_9PEZI